MRAIDTLEIVTTIAEHKHVIRAKDYHSDTYQVIWTEEVGALLVSAVFSATLSVCLGGKVWFGCAWQTGRPIEMIGFAQCLERIWTIARLPLLLEEITPLLVEGARRRWPAT